MKSKKTELFIICFICLILLVYGWMWIRKKNNVKIGVIGTMSGINSDLSVSGRRGVELAVDEANKKRGAKGRKIELVIKDDRNDPNIAKKCYEEFINEKIKLVIGPYTSGMIINSIDYLRNKDILILGPTISADVLSNIDDNFITFVSSTKKQASLLVNVAKKNNNKSFAVVYDDKNKGFNQNLYNNFKKYIEKDSGNIKMVKAFTSGDNANYSSLAEDIAKSKVDALFVIANSADNAAITQQIRKIGCKIQIYSGPWSNTDELIKKGGTAIEGMYIVGGIDLDNRSNDFMKFKENYINKYGENPTFSSVYSYEAAKALMKAIRIENDISSSIIKRNIIKMGNFKGLQNNYQINEFGDSTRDYMIFKVENGQLRKVD